MSSASIDYCYRYPFESAIDTREDGQLNLCLATSDQSLTHPYFFAGRLRHPRSFAEMLLVLSEVVRTHFFLPRPSMMDPVVTSSPDVLRLEGFSGCCGVYARIDMEHEFFDGQILGLGTTNVDFNDPMRGALSRIQDHHDVQFNVGREGVELTTDDQTVIEKKVKLPLRWIKSFSEAQAYLPRLQPRFEITSAEALRFFRSLPRTGVPKQKTWAVPMGKSLRLSQRESRGGVGLKGTHRIRIMEPLFHQPGSLRVYDDPSTGVSGWEFRGENARMLVLLSPEVYRGFSGEGQVLKSLAGNRWQDVLELVRARLEQGRPIDAARLSDQLNCDHESVTSALSVLGARGLAGFDLNRETYFYRQLPFHLDEVEKLQPRLKAARRLTEEGGIRVSNRILHNDADTEYELSVPGTGVEHLVRLRNDVDRCSCPWFSRHQGQRGPCKHILAARMKVDDEPTNHND